MKLVTNQISFSVSHADSEDFWDVDERVECESAESACDELVDRMKEEGENCKVSAVFTSDSGRQYHMDASQLFGLVSVDDDGACDDEEKEKS
jgi:hypothetical protein